MDDLGLGKLHSTPLIDDSNMYQNEWFVHGGIGGRRSPGENGRKVCEETVSNAYCTLSYAITLTCALFCFLELLPFNAQQSDLFHVCVYLYTL